eukprot:3063744-Amphidinium_carterae.1
MCEKLLLSYFFATCIFWGVWEVRRVIILEFHCVQRFSRSAPGGGRLPGCVWCPPGEGTGHGLAASSAQSPRAAH